MNIKIKSIKDLEGILGKKLARELCAVVTKGGNTRAKPSAVDFHDVKPPFYLNDSSTLTFYAVDVIDQKILSVSYGGSGDTTINHPGAQLSSGQATERDAVLAVTKYWNGSNMSWNVDVISSNIRKQIAMRGAE